MTSCLTRMTGITFFGIVFYYIFRERERVINKCKCKCYGFERMVLCDKT